MRRLKSALVLGGAGFLGSWIAEELARRQIETALVDLPGRQLESPVENLPLIEANVNEADLRSIVEAHDADVVFQLVGNAFVPASLDDPLGDLQLNARTTLNVLHQLEQAAKPPLLVFASSAAVYGNGQRMPMDEDHPFDPLSPYGVSKLAAERYVRVYAYLHDLPCFSVRPFSLYGPRQRKLVVYDLFRRLHGGENPLVVSAPAEVSRDFVFAEDAARITVSLAHSAPARGEAYNVAYGRATSLEELVGTILSVTGIDAEVQFTGDLRPGDPKHWFGDPARARALGAKCTTSLEEGLRQTNDWFLASHESTLK
jgi:UDP-glucose 4-epimerase